MRGVYLVILRVKRIHRSSHRPAVRTVKLGELLEDVQGELDRVVEGPMHRLAVELRRVEQQPQALEVGGGALEQRMRDGQLATGEVVDVGLSRQARSLPRRRWGKT